MTDDTTPQPLADENSSMKADTGGAMPAPVTAAEPAAGDAVTDYEALLALLADEVDDPETEIEFMPLEAYRERKSHD